MEEKKEKKTIKCSYALLVIVLFATVCFMTDYIIIERKINKCVCPTCNSGSNNEVINSNSNNNVVVPDNNEVDVVKESYDYPIVSSYETYNSDHSLDKAYIRINNRDFQLSDDSVGADNITVYKGMVIFRESFIGNASLVIMNSNGDILKKITNEDYRGNRFSSYEIRNDEIIIESNNLGFDSSKECELYLNNDNKEVIFTDKIDYLGNGQFSSIESVSSQGAVDYVNSNEAFYNSCSN